jgi:predicted enzyme related to lactoylglutathione lyase
MTDTATAIINKPAWVDLAAKDAAAAREFYGNLFGWDIEVNADPQYGGYARARIDGKDAAGISPTQSPDQPSAWNVYIGTDDIEALTRRVTEAGGTVAAPPFDVGDQGRMAVYQDPTGAFISAWQASRMGGFQTEGSNAFGWADLNARGVDKALPFYEKAFGWTRKPSGSAEQPYTEFGIGSGPTFAGAAEMNPMVPESMPNYWMVYFTVDDVDAAHRKALGLGASELAAPFDFPGGRMSIVNDPQGAAFGLMTLGQQ